MTEWLSFFVAYRYYRFLKKRQGDSISSENRLWILLGAALGALIGSRLVGALENPPAWQHSAQPFWYLYLNKTVLGGFLGGLLGVEGIKKVMGEQQSSGDLFTYPILLGLIVGRLGCFSMGVHEETYGTPTTFFMGMDLGDGLLRHPVSLYELFFLVVLWGLLTQIQKYIVLEEGALFKLFMISYLLFRFMLDFIKPHFTWKIGLSTIQVVALLGLLYYYRYLLNPKKLVKLSDA